MRPAPIPDDVAEAHPGRRIVVTGPNGDLTGPIPPVEAMVEEMCRGRALSVRCVLEDGDLDQLTAGAPIWLTFLGHMVPFDVRVGDL